MKASLHTAHGRLTSVSDAAPAGDPGVSAAVEAAARRCQAHGLDVVVESHRRRELQEGDVVVDGLGVVAGMIDDPRHCPRHLVGVRPLLTLATQIDEQADCAGAEQMRRAELQSLQQRLPDHL